jgi:hypothetical protein
MKQVIALFDYAGSEENQMLTLKKGDIIEVVQEASEDWWLGSANGEVGYFPKKFAKDVNDKRPYCTVLFDYEARDQLNELTIHKGDVLVLLNEEDSDWWEGELNGSKGYFPKTFVKKI